MKQIIYAMQFKGKAGPGRVGECDEGVRPARRARRSRPRLVPRACTGSIKPAPGGNAEFESEVTLTGETSFSGEGHYPIRRPQSFAVQHDRARLSRR